jgi:hypothetical protein
METMEKTYAITLTVHVRAENEEQAVNHVEDVLWRNAQVVAVVEPHVDGVVEEGE